jgi:hypothetical protein
MSSNAPIGKRVRLLVKSTGLNQKQPPTRLDYDAQKGVMDLAEAYNVYIDDTGRVCRRGGYAATVRTESSHSMFTGKTGTFFVAGTVLYKLNEDLTRTSVRTGLTADAEVSWLEVLNTIYYMNGHEVGRLVNGVYANWTVGTYQGPVTVRQFSAPPIGTQLEIYNGTMFVVVKNVLWYSERFGFNLFDMARNYIWFETDITMVKAVSDGLFVSTDRKVVFLKGRTPAEFEQINVSSYAAIKGTGVKLNAEELVGGKISGPAVLWTALNGIHLGVSGGESKNLTEDRIALPPVNSGCAVFYNGQYSVMLKR